MNITSRPNLAISSHLSPYKQFLKNSASKLQDSDIVCSERFPVIFAKTISLENTEEKDWIVKNSHAIARHLAEDLDDFFEEYKRLIPAQIKTYAIRQYIPLLRPFFTYEAFLEEEQGGTSHASSIEEESQLDHTWEEDSTETEEDFSAFYKMEKGDSLDCSIFTEVSEATESFESDLSLTENPKLVLTVGMLRKILLIHDALLKEIKKPKLWSPFSSLKKNFCLLFLRLL